MFLKYYLMQKHINHFMSEYNFFYKKKIFRITLKERFLKEKKGLEEIRIHCYKKQQQIKSLTVSYPCSTYVSWDFPLHIPEHWPGPRWLSDLIYLHWPPTHFFIHE